MEDNPCSWHEKLNWALWTNRITIKTSIKTNPYVLVYEKRAQFPNHIELSALRIAQKYSGEFES